MSATMRIALLVGPFPALSETFILQQITGLMDRGHVVDIYPHRKALNTKMHAEVLAYNLLGRTYSPPATPQSRILRLIKGLGLLCAHSWRAPAVFLRSLSLGWRGYPAGRLHLLYAVIPFLPRRTYDIVHCHFGSVGLRGIMLQQLGLLQGKLITTFHGADITAFPQRHGTAVYQPLFRQGDLFTVNSTFTAERAVALGCPKDKIVRLPVGLDMAKYVFRERTHKPGEPVRILTVARLVEKKGLEYAIRAVARVAEQYPHIDYAIVGDGPLRVPLERLIGELNLAAVIKLVGWKTQDEVLQLYAKAHLFILSSVTAADGDQEGQGLVLQEAQAVGLPILSTLHNGIPDGVVDGKSGFLVPERDVEALAERLSYLLRHPELWPAMGRTGRLFVEKHYDIQRLNDRLVEIYHKLLS